MLVQAEMWKSRWLYPKNTEQVTSTTDHEEGYLAVCGLATRYDSVFKGFKRDPHYRVVLEHVSEIEGREYLAAAREQDENLLKYAVKFQENDSLGSPTTFQYDVGRFSPTTLRYIKVLADLKNIFGDLNGFSVCEIGGGYGGQCKIISDVFSVASYTIVDLPLVIPLIRKYLERLRVSNVFYLTQGQITDPIESDLAISNYAFSECTRHVQDHYLENILDKARKGYLTYNFPKRYHFPSETSPYSKSGIIKQISKKHAVQIFEEKPRTGPMNFILVWDDGNSRVLNNERPRFHIEP